MKGKREHWPSFARQLRKEASDRIRSGEYPEREIKKALEIPDAYSKTFALSLIYRDLCASKMDGESVWKQAVSSAVSVSPEWKREEILEKMISWGTKYGRPVNRLPDMLGDRELRMKLLSKLVRISDEENVMKIWDIWRDRNEKDRYELLRIMVHNRFPREKALKLASELSPERVGMIESYMKGHGKKEVKNRVAPEIAPLNGPEPEFTMALYNTYKGKASEIHFRNISRAAALCYSFDLKLALIGFPFDDEVQCIERTLSSTRIGDGSEYLRELHRTRRFSLHKDISQIGLMNAVATTPHPDPEKNIGPEKIREGMIFLLGLGHNGLPKSVLESAKYHMEFTGKKASLETCTAMGVLANILHLRRKSYIVE